MIYDMNTGIDTQLLDNFLLVADEDQIIQVDSRTMSRSYRLSLTVTSQPQVLAYDWQLRDVYFTSGNNTNVIYKYSFDDRNTSVVYDDSSGMMLTTFFLHNFNKM